MKKKPILDIAVYIVNKTSIPIMVLKKKFSSESYNSDELKQNVTQVETHSKKETKEVETYSDNSNHFICSKENCTYDGFDCECLYLFDEEDIEQMNSLTSEAISESLRKMGF